MAAFLHDPAQAVNALTVGAHTHRDAITTPGTLTPVAQAGQLSPYTSTNASSTLPIKPEIVMEGGNACPDGTLMGTGEADLSILAADHRHAAGHLLGWTWATSAACAAATGLIAEIWNANPTRSPQTIRALLINAARWTPEICAQHPDRRERLRAVGYGQPQRDIALTSTQKRQRSSSRTRSRRNSHLRPPRASCTSSACRCPATSYSRSETIPSRWPSRSPTSASPTKHVGSATPAPASPGTYSDEARTTTSSVRRVNDIDRPKGQKRPKPADPWTMQIGPEARSRGTVQSDRLRTDAASLAGDKHIAVWPIRGWWADHPKTRAASTVTYLLVVTIDAGDADIDLHALIETRIDLSVDAT